jgi:glycine/D-amino acid oxidase-like deaminating enzyme
MFLAIHPETIASRVARFGDRDVQASGFEWREMDPYEWVSIGLVGRTNANAGIRAKDSVIDFPALLRDLIQTLPSRQRLLDRRVISVITDTPTGSKRRVTGVLCSTSSGEKRFPCDRCVLAAGAWTPLILEESGISLKPLLIRKKCVVITFEGELVPGITVCYDITHFDPNRKQLVEADVSLVPYRGTTLAAGTGWSRLGPDVEPRGIEPTAEEIEELYMELYQAFPLLWRLRSKAKPHACIKTELDTGTGPPNVLPQLFD